MARHIVRAKSLPEPMLAYCQLDFWEQTSVKFESEFYRFHSRKCTWKCCLPEWQPFCPGDEFTHWLLMAPCNITKLSTLVQMVASLQWRHNGCDCVSNHQPHDCLLNRLFRRRSKKTPKLRVTGLFAGNSPETGEFPAQMAGNTENVSIWWRHHVAACSSPSYWLPEPMLTDC